MSEDILKSIDEQVKSHAVVLYMKGDKQFPQCGFSQQVVQILKLLEVDFLAVNVLADEFVRQGIKEYADWPTIPQLYIQGEFVGGCDIIKEMHASGDLQAMLNGVLAK